MANLDIRVGKKNAAFFAANPTLILKDGQFIFNSDTSELFIGDGTTQLSSLVAINGASYTLTTSEIGSVINAATTATPNDTDLVISVDSSVAKKNTWTQIKTFLKTYFDTIYTTTSAVASQITSALSGYVNTSGLTANYIPKASDSDTLANSQIFDNGTNVGVGTTTPIQKLVVQTNTNGDGFILQRGTNQYLVGFQNDASSGGYLGLYDGASTAKLLINAASFSSHDWINTGRNMGLGTSTPTAKLHVKGSNSNPTDLCALFVNSSNAEILKLRNDRAIIIDSLTASQILELDTNKVVISAAKNSGYNLALGTTAGTVAEGNDTRITQAVRTIYKDFTASAALTGTTAITLINSALIPANTVSVGNEVEIKARAQRDTTTGNASMFLYFNTSASLSGATLIATLGPGAVAYYAMVRSLFVKSVSDSESANTTVSLTTSEAAATSGLTMASLNIDWTSNVYIIQAFQNAAVGNSTTSRGMMIKLS
jgi:hypothetical protein